MSDIDAVKARLKEDRRQLLKGLEMMRAGTFTTGEVDGRGNTTDRTSETIHLYEGIVAQIDNTLAWIESNASRA